MPAGVRSLTAGGVNQHDSSTSRHSCAPQRSTAQRRGSLFQLRARLAPEAPHGAATPHHVPAPAGAQRGQHSDDRCDGKVGVERKTGQNGKKKTERRTVSAQQPAGTYPAQPPPRSPAMMTAWPTKPSGTLKQLQSEGATGRR